MNLADYLENRCKQIDRALKSFLPAVKVRPATIHKAMHYSLFAGGKRLRPVLCLAAAEACGGAVASALAPACAVECLHTYSLIHDDLPCMDDDDFRRGRPTSHKVFGDAIAVLAGDALLTEAFAILAQTKPTKRYGTKDYLVEFADAAGSQKLIAGQVADIEAEGRKISRAHLQWIHECKTAAVLTSSFRLGAMAANATPAQLKALTTFGARLGLAFQVIDDILDVTQTSEKLGKSAGKDIDAKKSTYPSILGLAASRREAKRLTTEAISALKPFGKRGSTLLALATHLLDREY
ncbi:MAG: polyprenyl synthetase family protein [Chthoniobacterales bacterium]